jgi:hypothetical protein
MFAPALLKAVGSLLDQLPIAYTMRIETTGAQVYQHSHTIPERGQAGTEATSAGGSSTGGYYPSRLSVESH